MAMLVNSLPRLMWACLKSTALLTAEMRVARLSPFSCLHLTNRRSATMDTLGKSCGDQRVSPQASTSRYFSIKSRTIYNIISTLEKPLAFNESLYKIETVEDLLEYCSSTKMSSVASLVIVRKLAQILDTTREMSADVIFADSRFRNALEFLYKDIDDDDLLRSLIQDLMFICNSESSVSENVKNEIFLVLENEPSIRFVSQVVIGLYNQQESPFENQIFGKALKILQSRCTEIQHPSVLVDLMFLFKNLHDDFFSKLEETASSLAGCMTSVDLYKAVQVMQFRNRRNTPLLRTLMFHLKNSQIQLEDWQLIKLLGFCSRLQFGDSQLLAKICNLLKVNNNYLAIPNQIFNFYVSLSFLRWRQIDILDMLFTSLCNYSSAISSKKLAYVFTSASILNYSNRDLESLWQFARQRLEYLQHEDPCLWLDIVWSMSSQQLLDENLAVSVLNESFLASLPANDQYKMKRQNVRLQNIECCARNELPRYSGPYLSDNFNINPQDILRANRKLSESVVDTLCEIAPRTRYVRPDVLMGGFYVDAEMVVDKNGQPKLLADHIDPSPEHYRLAIFVLDYHDMTHCTVVPTGVHAFAMRQLQYLGYTVVQVPYTVYLPNGKLVERVQILKGLINDAIKEANSQKK